MRVPPGVPVTLTPTADSSEQNASSFDGWVEPACANGPVTLSTQDLTCTAIFNQVTHQTTVWYMGGVGGNVRQSWKYLSNDGVLGWKVVATADFDGDLKPDLVWQSDDTRQVIVWYMGGDEDREYEGWNYLSTDVIPSGWRVAGAGDFNADGKPDLVWENDSTRQVTIWYMGATENHTMQNWTFVPTDTVPAGWRVVAVADFNHDGVPDLVWQSDSTRQATVWYMGGTGGSTMQSWAFVSADGVPGWQITGAADLNGDGVPDLLLQNDSRRQR